MPPAQVRGRIIKVLNLRHGIKKMSLGGVSITSWFLHHDVYIGLSFELNMINGDKAGSLAWWMRGVITYFNSRIDVWSIVDDSELGRGCYCC